ncbi:MAG: septum formation initiator family protein [Rikenellaceae bacterium]
MAKKSNKIFSNRNIIIGITVLFIGWLFFFDQNSFMRMYDVDREVEQLRQECQYYRDAIARDSTVIAGLGDSAFVEKYARDNFYWHSEDEELYIIRAKK